MLSNPKFKADSPPNRLLLRQISLASTSKSFQDGSTKLSPDRIQSDNPSQSDSYTFPNFDGPSSSKPSRPPISHKIHNSDNSMEPNFSSNSDEVWALEGSEVSLECVASPSSPVSRLLWILSSVAEFESDLSLPPTFDFESFSEQSRTLHYDREYPTWRYVFSSREDNGLGYKVDDKETADATSGLQLE
ncbi:hypothetical protein ACTXT7_006586 [Hymenolepis weldensis]